jgi:prepilin-type N-terminal cleavage/methylation domain-containing protein
MLKTKGGFTLLEMVVVLAVLGILAALVMPSLTNTTRNAREKIDIITGQELKTALDRYEAYEGTYPKLGEMSTADGNMTGVIIPGYIRPLNQTVVQQGSSSSRGFAVASWSANSTRQRVIMLYLTDNGKRAEVAVYSGDLQRVLWKSF